MKLLTPALLAASALTVCVPAVAQAQSYQAQSYQECENARQNRQVAGAIIGGILGAVIGNELADDSNNNRHGRPDRYDRRARWDDRARHHSRYDRRYEHRDRGNAEEVGTIAGAGVGAVIGAGIAGGDDCGRQTYRASDPYAGKPSGYGYQDSYYDDGYSDEYYYADDNGGGGNYAYEDYGSSGELLGGSEQRAEARIYNTAAAPANGQCQWSQTRRLNAYGEAYTDQVYMCQGMDGIWRPADTYGE
ncbi:hypothetical protein [Maricaulis parjimensis]|uniref:hypothetical protein n=1 Tax=Maricaulis parjimensis TaxID=144023 RepID=UPI0019399204|nr:hypothetical protein [Maricaulis parjimensis]